VYSGRCGHHRGGVCRYRVIGRQKGTGAQRLCRRVRRARLRHQELEGHPADRRRRPRPARVGRTSGRDRNPPPRLQLHRRLRRFRSSRRRVVLHRLRAQPGNAVHPHADGAVAPRRAQRVHHPHRHRVVRLPTGTAQGRLVGLLGLDAVLLTGRLGQCSFRNVVLQFEAAPVTAARCGRDGGADAFIGCAEVGAAYSTTRVVEIRRWASSSSPRATQRESWISDQHDRPRCSAGIDDLTLMPMDAWQAAAARTRQSPSDDYQRRPLVFD
jgi:hypothetical protein